MDSKGFKIGNLVHDRKDRLCEIVELLKEPTFEGDKNYKAQPLKGPIHSLPLKYIFLTEEWLRKLGFKKWKNKKIWTKKRVMIYCHSKYGFCYGAASKRTKLEYVHSLQNLYSELQKENLSL